MKRLLPLMALLLVSSALPGCPIYENDDENCFDDSECAPGYVCDFPSGRCRRLGDSSCAAPSDCEQNRTCSRAGRCEVGDCTWPSIGCVSGYVCAAPDDRWVCVRDSGGAAGAGGSGADAGGASSEAGAGGASAGSSGAPAEAGAGGAI